MRTAVLWVVGAAALGAGCRDLQVADTTRGSGPTIAVVSPLAGDVVPVRWRVELEVEDVDGVATVSLMCGLASLGDRRPLHAWSRAPFIADLDLSPCLLGAVASRVDVELTVLATDGTGLPSTASRTFEVDRQLPRLEVEVPQRVAPRSEVVVRMRSLDPLAAPPVVLAGDQVVATAVAGPGAWEARFTAPGVGSAQSPAAGQSVDLEALEQALTVRVTARNEVGNEVVVTRQVTASPIAWERELPGRVSWDPADGGRPQADDLPVATSQGLSLPLRTEQQDQRWIPGRYLAASGTLQVLLEEQSSFARGFTAGGLPVMDAEKPMQPESQVLDWDDGQVLATANRLPAYGPLIRLPQRTCVQTYSGCSQLSFSCVGGPNSPTTGALPNIGTRARYAAVSGEVALAVGFVDDCAGGMFKSQTALTWDGTLARAHTLTHVDDQGWVRRLLPIGDRGEFAITQNTTNEVITYRLGKGGLVQGSITRHGDDRIPVAALPESLALVVERMFPTPQLELWPEGAAAATATLSLPFPFRYEASPNSELAPLPINVATFQDDRLMVLGRTHGFGRAVVALDAGLKPAWLYRYPRGTSGLLLIQGGPGSLIYLLDWENHRVVALHPSW